MLLIYKQTKPGQTSLVFFCFLSHSVCIENAKHGSKHSHRRWHFADDLPVSQGPPVTHGWWNCHPHIISQYCPWDPHICRLQGANPFGLNPVTPLSMYLPLNTWVVLWALAGLPMSECSAGWQPEHSAPCSGFQGKENRESSSPWWWLTNGEDGTALFVNCWPDLLPQEVTWLES